MITHITPHQKYEIITQITLWRYNTGLQQTICFLGMGGSMN